MGHTPALLWPWPGHTCPQGASKGQRWSQGPAAREKRATSPLQGMDRPQLPSGQVLGTMNGSVGTSWVNSTRPPRTPSMGRAVIDCLSTGPGVPTAFWTWRADPVRYGPGPPAPSSVRWPVLTLGTWGTEEARAGVKSGAPLFAVRPHCWVQPLSLSSRVCSWGYFVSLARCKTPANNSTWGRVVCGSGGPQPCVATAQGKMSVPSSALCSRRTMPAGWRLPVPAPQHPRGQGRRKESHPPCLLHLLLGKTPA